MFPGALSYEPEVSKKSAYTESDSALARKRVALEPIDFYRVRVGLDTSIKRYKTKKLAATHRLVS